MMMYYYHDVAANPTLRTATTLIISKRLRRENQPILAVR